MGDHQRIPAVDCFCSFVFVIRWDETEKVLLFWKAYVFVLEGVLVQAELVQLIFGEIA